LTGDEEIGNAFGTGDPFSVGVEEELFLVDPVTGRQANASRAVLDRLGPVDGTVERELHACQIELITDVCHSAGEAVGTLGGLRRAVIATGAGVLGAGTHPSATEDDAEITDKERYERIRDLLGDAVATPVAGLHIHVGMPDPETAIRVANGLRTHLPLLAGLAANSPFWHGVDSGLHSARAALVRAYPGRGVPRAYRDFADYEHALETTLRAAGMEDRTQLWWDVRPHPRMGTIEVREMDAQTELRDVLPLAALVQCLARHEAERGTPVFIPRDALDWSSFRAARDGLDAEILDEDGRVRPLREVARTLLSRLVMVAGELDCGDALEDVERLLEEGNGADRQRAEHERSGIDGLVRDLTARTLAS